MKIEDFIKLRKTQDQVDEFDINKKMNNLHQFVDYIFEYFALYIDVDNLERRKIERDEKIVKYQKRLSDYSLEVQNWLITIYAEYDIQLIGPLRKCVLADALFRLYYNSNGWRKFTFNAYATLKNKHPYLEEYTNELYLFAVDESKRLNGKHLTQISEEDEVKLPAEIVEWVKHVGKSNHIDLLSWASDYVGDFFNQEKTWPKSHIFLEGKDIYYDIRVKKNRFNLDNYFQKLGEMEYLKGKKKFLEVLLVYKWIADIDDKFQDYFETYLEKQNLVK